MVDDVAEDQLAVIKIEGMHCHRCELAIQRALSAHAGVREVEVDFNSGQASVLFAKGSVSVKTMMETIEETGYHATGFRQTGAPTEA